jgi:hypothetical protein
MANVTITEQELAALRLAAKFVLDHADQIDYRNQFALDLLKMTSPNATYEAAQQTQNDATQQTRDLDATLAALKAAGLDA